jgi:hypothetical protein
MRWRHLLLALLCVTLTAGLALAAPVLDEKKPALGAHGMITFIPDGILDAAYVEHTSIAATGYGLWASYGFTQYDLLFQLNNWHLNIGEGKWRGAGKGLDERYFIDADLGMVDINMSVLWKWRVHEAVEPFVGPMFGAGILWGRATLDESVNESDPDAGVEVGDPENNPKEKDLPPVIPNIGLLFGCRFYPHPNVRIAVDLGLHYGLAAGLSMGYAF